MTSSPTNEEMLEIYALYKQATVGDVNKGRRTRERRLTSLSQRNYLINSRDILIRSSQFFVWIPGTV